MSSAPQPMPSHPDAHVLDLLAPQTPWLRTTETTFVPAHSGLCNISFIATRADGVRFVLRQSRGDDPELGISRAAEEQALRALSLSGLGPEIIAWHPGGHLLTTFIPHESVAVDPGAQWLRSAPGLVAVAQALRRFHALPSNGKAFDPVTAIAHRLRWAAAQSNRPDAAAAAISGLTPHAACVRTVADGLAADRPRGSALVHGDCFPSNILRTGTGFRIIDVEFSGVGDGLYDLACLAFSLDQAATRDLVSHYQPGTDAEVARTLRALHQYQYIAGVWDATWALIQLIRARPGHDYTGHLAHVLSWANGHQVFTGQTPG